MKIFKFLNRKQQVTFHMKSGAALTFKCDGLTTKKQGNELVGYEMRGNGSGAAHYIRIEDVSAITVNK